MEKLLPKTSPIVVYFVAGLEQAGYNGNCFDHSEALPDGCGSGIFVAICGVSARRRRKLVGWRYGQDCGVIKTLHNLLKKTWGSVPFF
jgi:hypothetical protein